MAGLAKTMEAALDELSRDRHTPVRARIGGLLVELRAVEEPAAPATALDLFDAVGRWSGDDANEVADAISAGRRDRPKRLPVGL